MGLYRVVLKQGQKALDNLAGATRGEGCPLGMWAGFENDIAPNSNWLRAGTTFDATVYPSLDLYLGGNTVPNRYDHSRLGEPIACTATTFTGAVLTSLGITGSGSQSDPWVFSYDGYWNIVSSGATNNLLYYIKDENNEWKLITRTYQYNGVDSGTCIPFKAGTQIYRQNVSWESSNVEFYTFQIFKHPLFIKATSNMSESEATGILNLINQRESYSTEEINTGKKWIDGKPIYKKCIPMSSSSTVSGDWTTFSNFLTGMNVEQIVKGSFRRTSDNTIIVPEGIKASNNNLYIQVYANWNGFNLAILEYTKTTD